MSSFFTLPASQKKRKRLSDIPSKPHKKRGQIERSNTQDRPKLPRQQHRREEDKKEDDDISDFESEEDVEAKIFSGSEASSEADETAGDRRIRLAQRYLDNIREDIHDEVGFDAKDLDDEIIARRLGEDADESKGRQFRLIADTLDWKKATSCAFRADTLATTGVAVCQPYAYTVSKDKTLIKWKLHPPKSRTATSAVEPNEGKKPAPGRKRPEQMAYVKGVSVRASAEKQYGHTGPILCVAASPDGNFVATGGGDRKLIVWSAEDLRPLKTFTTHRDAVLDLAFAPSTSSQPGFGQQLFSASADRSLKTYNLAGEESLAYVETLFGHQDHVQAVSAMTVDLCVSVGARDRSARVWKVVEERQLKFLGDSSAKDRYQTGSLDAVAAVTSKEFLTGSDAGAISLWSVTRKKALFTVHAAHGVDDPPTLEDVTSESDPRIIEELKRFDMRRETPRAITALVALPGTDVFLSGSWDGWVRVWKIGADKRSIASLGVLGQGLPDEQGSMQNGLINGHPTGSSNTLNGDTSSSLGRGPIRGVVNAMAVFERRKELKGAFGEKKEGPTRGLCVVVGTGKDLKLGRHQKFERGRNGAMVFEIPTL